MNEKALRQEDNTEVDFSEYFDHMYFKCINICGPVHSGKSLFLSAAKDYWDCGAGCGMEDHDEMTIIKRDRHPVIFIDFSDFCGTG